MDTTTTTATVTLTAPTIHLNGTGRTGLERQLRDAHAALQTAIDALCEAAPHGRDYYTQGADAYPAAREQHVSRLQRLTDVQGELEQLYARITEQG